MQAETFFNQEDSAFFPSLINDGKIPVVPFLKASTHFGNFFSMNELKPSAFAFFDVTQRIFLTQASSEHLLRP